MLYEYPNKFIVPIIYINTSDYDNEKSRIKENKCSIETEMNIVDSVENKEEKNNEKHKLEKSTRDSGDCKNTSEDFDGEDVISESHKDYYLESMNMYSEIDDEYAKDETKKK